VAQVVRYGLPGFLPIHATQCELSIWQAAENRGSNFGPGPMISEGGDTFSRITRIQRPAISEQNLCCGLDNARLAGASRSQKKYPTGRPGE
jgi:hypothetical protein